MKGGTSTSSSGSSVTGTGRDGSEPFCDSDRGTEGTYPLPCTGDGCGGTEVGCGVTGGAGCGAGWATGCGTGVCTTGGGGA